MTIFPDLGDTGPECNSDYSQMLRRCIGIRMMAQTRSTNMIPLFGVRRTGTIRIWEKSKTFSTNIWFNFKAVPMTNDMASIRSDNKDTSVTMIGARHTWNNFAFEQPILSFTNDFCQTPCHIRHNIMNQMYNKGRGFWYYFWSQANRCWNTRYELVLTPACS